MVKRPRPVTVDFETFAIEARPYYPPAPVGVSIQWPEKRPRYWSWGHPTGNNCTRAEARAELVRAWAHEDGVLCHNGKFDFDVAEVHLGLPFPPWARTHETMFLLFLDDPHSSHLGLKEAAAHLLRLPPEERDVVVDWLVQHQPIPGRRLGRGKQSKDPAAAQLALAPGDLVGGYANGDTDRTTQLFERLWRSVVVDRKMGSAYDRERRVLPILLASERAGVRVDVERLAADVARYEGWAEQLDAWVRSLLRAPDLNVDSGAQLAELLIARGWADPALMGQTKTGNVATNKVAIEAGVTEPVMSAVLRYRARLQTCLGTFMRPWLAMAWASGGFIYTTWHQVKAINGARTGRLSSTPNFQNLPKEFDPLFAHEAHREEDLKRRAKLLKAKSPWPDLPALPLCRSYVVPYEDGHVLVGRDFSQQELRILGHFEDGVLLQAYRDDPWLDVHDFARDLINGLLKTNFARKPIKNTGFGLIYGMGIGKLAIQSNSSVEDAKLVKDAYLQIFPGLKDLTRDLKAKAKANESFRTWSGREIFCESPKLIDGKLQEFDYKMLNYLIQSSAAEATKEVMIRFVENCVQRMHNHGWKLLLQVHDEIVLSVPYADLAEAQETLRNAMESIEFDVVLLSEGEWSIENWSSMKKYDQKGKIVYATA